MTSGTLCSAFAETGLNRFPSIQVPLSDGILNLLIWTLPKSVCKKEAPTQLIKTMDKATHKNFNANLVDRNFFIWSPPKKSIKSKCVTQNGQKNNLNPKNSLVDPMSRYPSDSGYVCDSYFIAFASSVKITPSA